MFEINEKRLIKTFIDLVKIPSPSWDEKKIIDYIISKLKTLNIKYYKFKCNNSYNLLIKLNGDPSKKPILFSAHLDTVTPCKNIKLLITDKKISTKGNTILGSDDKAAIAMFIEGLYFIKEKNLSHGSIEILLTCAEELGLQGAKAFDMKKLKSKFAFVFDSDGKIGKIITKAPFHSIIEIEIIGKAAHAGIEPEKGINAINILSEIITKIPSARIDHETTINIGTISGGTATNIVADSAFCKLEIRSIDKKKLKSLEALIKKVVKDTTFFYKSKSKISINLQYSGFAIKYNDSITKLTIKALNKIKIKPRFEITGGGSDTNIFNKAGIKAINLSCGMQKVHTNKEFIFIKDLIDGTKLMLSIIDSV